MNKIKRRALIILALVAFLALGSAYFLIILETDGEDWAAFASNTHTHTNGILTSGQVRDRNGVLLLSTDEEGNRVYSDDYSIRMATPVSYTHLDVYKRQNQYCYRHQSDRPQRN